MKLKGNKKKWNVFDTVNNTWLILISIICIYPFINIAAVSFSDGANVMAGKVFLWPRGFNIETYKYIFNNPRLGIRTGITNSFIYSICGTLFAVTLTFVTAYALSKKRLVGRYTVMFLFVIVWIFDGGLIPTYLVNKELGLVDSFWIMILPGALNTFLLIVTRSFLETIPIELEESAFIDGANDLQIMRDVFLPLSKPVMATISLFYAVGIWNSFLVPLIYLHDQAKFPIQLILYKLVIRPDPGSTTLELIHVGNLTLYPRNVESAVIFLAMVPILLMYPFAQKYFTKGLLIGSVKG